MFLMSSEKDFDRTRDELSRAIADAIAATEAERDNALAYRHASRLADVLADGVSATSKLRGRIARRWRDAEGLSLAQLGERLGLSRGRTGDLIRERGAARRPEPAPVVAAVLTSALGILATRRNDARPPWGFVTGKIEPGESAADAAVREVKEETGLEVVAGRVLGRRVHPETQRTIIYLAVRPAEGTDPASATVCDETELAEVRWLSLEEIDALMPGVYAPVRSYLDREPRRRKAQG